MSTTETYSASYFKTRNYCDYLSRKFDALAADVVSVSCVSSSDRIVDFGCGYGGLMASIHNLGFQNIRGTDISTWAIDEGKRRFPNIASRLEYYNRNLLTHPHHLLLILDVMEHMPEHEVETVLRLANLGCTGNLIVRIPVSADEGEPFVLPVSNNDPTHITCHTKNWWFEKFDKAGWSLRSGISRTSIYDSPGVLCAIFNH